MPKCFGLSTRYFSSFYQVLASYTFKLFWAFEGLMGPLEHRQAYTYRKTTLIRGFIYIKGAACHHARVHLA